MARRRDYILPLKTSDDYIDHNVGRLGALFEPVALGMMGKVKKWLQGRLVMGVSHTYYADMALMVPLFSSLYVLMHNNGSGDCDVNCAYYIFLILLLILSYLACLFLKRRLRLLNGGSKIIFYTVYGLVTLFSCVFNFSFIHLLHGLPPEVISLSNSTLFNMRLKILA